MSEIFDFWGIICQIFKSRKKRYLKGGIKAIRKSWILVKITVNNRLCFFFFHKRPKRRYLWYFLFKSPRMRKLPGKLTPELRRKKICDF